MGVSPTSKNRPSKHKYKSPKQFELKRSWKALRTLNARCRYLFIQSLWTKTQKLQTFQKRVLKLKNQKTNTIRFLITAIKTNAYFFLVEYIF